MIKYAYPNEFIMVSQGKVENWTFAFLDLGL